MKKFDVIVIGAGSGLDVASYARRQGLEVAIVEDGPMGGTCLNRGCIPSKMLIHATDVAEIIRESGKHYIDSEIKNIDFGAITKWAAETVDKDAAMIEAALEKQDNVTLYKVRGKFTGPKTLQVGDEEITADKIFIVAGTRPFVPPIPGVEDIDVLTSREALRLTEQPEHLVVIGGGYIGSELAHFYGGLGTKMTMLVREDKMMTAEDSEISDWFTKAFTEKYEVRLNTEAESFEKSGDTIKIKIKNSDEVLEASHVLMATGRKPNTDELNVEAAGIEMNERGYIKVDDYLETNVEGVYAFGDIVGILPFKHTANHQVRYAITNGFTEHQIPVDYSVIGHAAFTNPQVAGVGKTEDELKEEGVSYKVGKYEYKNTGMGMALKENGLVKALVGEDGKILGCHIVGPEASTLIHQVAIAMKANGHVNAILDTVHIHPALSEVVQRAFRVAIR